MDRTILLILIGFLIGLGLEIRRRRKAKALLQHNSGHSSKIRGAAGHGAAGSPGPAAAGPGRARGADRTALPAREQLRAVHRELGAPARIVRTHRVHAGGRPARRPRRADGLRDAVCARRELAAGLRRLCGAQAAGRSQRRDRSGDGAVRQARALDHVFRARLFPRRPSAAAGRRRGRGRQGMVARQPDPSPVRAGLLRAARSARRHRGFRRGARRTVGIASRSHQDVSRSREPSVRERACGGTRPDRVQQHRSGLPDELRPLLVGPGGFADTRGAGGLAPGACGGRGDAATGDDPAAAGERRAAGRQDLVPAAAGRSARTERLERVRGQRRRSHGRPAMVRPARRPHPRGRRSAHRRQEADLVHPGPAATRPQRHASGPEREHPRPDPARRRLRPARGLDRGHADQRIAAAAGAAGAAQHFRGRPDRTAGRGRHACARPRSNPQAVGYGRHDSRSAMRRRRGDVGAAVSQRGELPRIGAATDQAHRHPRREGRGDRARRRDRDAGAADRPAGLHPRQQGAPRPRGDAELLRRPRDRPGRGRCQRGGPHRDPQGRAQRSEPADRRVPVRGADRHRQDRACQDRRRIPVRIGRPHDPSRHERVPDAGVDGSDRRQCQFHRYRLADHQRAQAAVLGDPAGRIREGPSAHLGPVPAGVRRCAADRRARPGRGFPPLPDHHDDQSRRHQPPDRGPGLRAGRRRVHARADQPRDQPDLPAGIPEPDRQDHRVPAADARPDARDPAQGARRNSRTARPEEPRMGGRMGGVGAGVPARKGLLAGDGRPPAQARDRAVRDRAAGGHHRRVAVSGRRPVRVLPQRRPRHPGRVRRSRQGCIAGRGAAEPGRRRRAGSAGGHDPVAARHGRRVQFARRRSQGHPADARLRRTGRRSSTVCPAR